MLDSQIRYTLNTETRNGDASLQNYKYSHSLSFNLALDGVDDQRQAAATLLR